MASITSYYDQFSPYTTLVLWLGVPVALASLYAFSPQTAALSVFVLSAPILFFWHISADVSPLHLETFLWTLCGVATLGVAAVATVQSLLAQQIAYVFLGSEGKAYFEEFTRSTTDDLSNDHKEKRAKMAWKWQYIAFLIVFTYLLAGLLEELTKYLAIVIANRQQTDLQGMDYVYLAIAATLGFSTMENIGFIYAARDHGAGMVLMTTIERILIGMPAHALSGCLIAVGVIRRDLQGESIGTLRILCAPMLYHGTFDFSLFAMCAWHGDVGWIHPKESGRIAVMLSFIFIILVTAFLHLRMEMRDLGMIV